ncbi:MAG: hypothetical protein A2Z11_03230 [Candidatus Woykebacteria bacterium RBG_16_43_9]|uniref:Phosphoribosylformylglycinamidine synthase linker domain-containing protein n=1 Tax=Candidatus Woykebacteria bacterium RBG_16_43_9 TaxID=1802596 RepID=A0A1G1WHR1_9BACT|nr:MAG: hypothetical protein A2Z11_03230 [Candidatus Woykebacteria bacterium RBG_16_43_9]
MVKQEIARKLDELGIPHSDYEEIVRRLGRKPNTLELGLFGTMWSEHSSYRSSKPLLGVFDTLNDSLGAAESDTIAERHDRLIQEATEREEASDKPGTVSIGGLDTKTAVETWDRIHNQPRRDMWKRYEEALKKGTAKPPPNPLN